MPAEGDGRDQLRRDLVSIVEDLTRDWDLEFSGTIGGSTKLIGELAFESIDVVQLIVAIEERYQRRDLPFEDLLMSEGRYVDEITIDQIADFLHPRLAAARSAGPAGAGAR